MLRSRLIGITTAAAVIGAMVIGVPSVHADGPDTTPPNISIISPIEGQQVPIGVEELPTVQYACDDDDVADPTCDASIGPVDGSNSPLTVGNGMPLDLTQPGRYLLRVTSTDTAGNQAASTVQFEMVGEEPRDDTAPSIQIQAPVDGAQVMKGATLTATYLCQDSGSGIESCDGTVSSGAAVDTSTRGLHDFTVVARDNAGNESTETVQYEVIAPASVTVSGTISDVQGNLLPGSTVEARLTGTNEVVASTEANTDGVYSLTVPEGTYDLRYRGPAALGIGANVDRRDLTGDAEINVRLGVLPATVSGTVGDGVGGQLSYAQVRLLDPNGSEIANSAVGSDGQYSFEVVPGRYVLSGYGVTSNLSWFSLYANPIDITGDTVANLTPDSRAVTVHLIGADGSSAAGQVQLNCSIYYGPWGQWQEVNTRAIVSGSGDITTYGTPTPAGRTCSLIIDPEDGPVITRQIDIDPTTGAELTITVEPGVKVSGTVGDGVGGQLSYAQVR